MEKSAQILYIQKKNAYNFFYSLPEFSEMLYVKICFALKPKMYSFTD